MVTFAAYQRRKIKERRRDIRPVWLIVLGVVLVVAIGFGLLLQAIFAVDEVPVWMATAIAAVLGLWATRGQMDGTHYLKSSIEAEGWTTSALRRALGRQWHVVTGVDFGPQGDVDQIVIGPLGVYVIETKSTESFSIHEHFALDWGEQATKNARRVRLMLKHNYGQDVDVTPVIVVSGMRGLELPGEGDGVPIVRRGELKSHVATLTAVVPSLSSEDVESIRAALLDYRGQRADYERESAEGLALTAF